MAQAPQNLVPRSSTVGRWDVLVAAGLAVAAVVATFDAWADILRLGLADEELSYVLLAPVVIGWLGWNVDRSGNLLSINGVDVTVAEACNGMRMVLTLFLVCYVVAFTMKLRTWVRLLILAAAPLVAIVSNVLRLVPTVWMFGHTSVAAAERFHDVSGWVMTVLS